MHYSNIWHANNHNIMLADPSKLVRILVAPRAQVLVRVIKEGDDEAQLISRADASNSAIIMI